MDNSLQTNGRRRLMLVCVLILFIIAGWWGCVRPLSQATVPIPGLATVVRMQLLPGFDEGSYQVHISNKKGKLIRKLWSNWGPAIRATFYLAPGNRLVVIGGGADTYVFDIDDCNAPKISSPNLLSADGQDWLFLGTTDGRDPIEFIPPARRAECIDLLGAGESPYRRLYQAEGSCQ